MDVKVHGGPNQTSVEKGGDELWVAEKFQSNLDIAGSPRNSFRASLDKEIAGGRALNGLGGHKAYRTLSNCEYRLIVLRESVRERSVPRANGEHPRSSAKVPKCTLSGEGCGIAQTTRMLAQKQPHIQRVRNSSLVE